METFGALVKQARLGSYSQKTFGELLGFTEAYVSQIERGTRVPPLPVVLRMHAVLAPAPVPLERWLLTWLVAKAGSDVESPGDLARVTEAARRLENNAPVTVRARKGLPLEDFPDAFYPLTIVCGDRRESTPQTPADIFVYSLAVTDLMFLPRVLRNPDVTIKSDKLFLLMDQEYLREKFGKTNLLVIGSPAVNLAARIINDHAVFRVDYPRSLKDWQKLFLEQIQSNSPDGLRNMTSLAVFWKMVGFVERKTGRRGTRSEAPERFRYTDADYKEFSKLLSADELSKFDRAKLEQLGATMDKLVMGKGPSHVMNEFRKPGLLDPADMLRHGQSTRANNDFGFISVAPNPFAESTDYVAVLASGIHGPGTAHAVRALAEGDFSGHPLGGVIEVTLDQFKDWPTRFEKAEWGWQTRPYTPRQLIDNLRGLRGEEKGQAEAFLNVSDDDIQYLVEFCEMVAGISAADPGEAEALVDDDARRLLGGTPA